MKIQVSGMTCGGCAKAVTRALEALPGVDRALVDLSSGEVAVDGQPSRTDVRRAIEDAGFDVKAVA